MKKVVIDLKPVLNDHGLKDGSNPLKLTDVSKKYGISRQTFENWRKQAPDVVETLFYILKDNPKTDVFKALKGWQKPPYVLAFLKMFLEDYECGFLDVVKEV